MNARARFGAGSDARLEIILRLKIAFVGQVVYREVEIDPRSNPFGHAESMAAAMHAQASRPTNLASVPVSVSFNGAVRAFIRDQSFDGRASVFVIGGNRPGRVFRKTAQGERPSVKPLTEGGYGAAPVRLHFAQVD